MDDDDIFSEVAQQLKEEVRWSELDQFQDSCSSFKCQQLSSSFDNRSGSIELLRRKPLKSREKESENLQLSAQACSKLSEAPQKFKCLDFQLNRLEKTLNYTKSNSIYPHFKRQKTLLKRLSIANKQNVSKEGKKERGISINCNSQFLQEIKGLNEELYEIYLSLYRFHQKEKQINATLLQQIKQQSDIGKHNEQQLEQLKSTLVQILAKIEIEQSNQHRIQLDFMRTSLLQYFQNIG